MEKNRDRSRLDASRFVAHRGYASKYPENTLLSMAKAVEAGAVYLECDVQLTADKVPVVHHDPDLRRSAGAEGCVMDLRLEELSRHRFTEPGRLGDKFSNVGVTTLRDLAGLLLENPKVTLFVELKEESLERFGTELMVERVMQAITPAIDRCVAISFADAPLTAAAKSGWRRTGWVLRRFDDEHKARAEELSPDYLFCNHKKIPPVPGGLWRGKWKWALYEITDARVAEEWFQLGADMVETMDIGGMLDAFGLGKPKHEAR
ncbi:MAG: glycerophosphodiester phosphodiesterase [Nitrospinae bacterium]|nr:glycerophosphodiester phosphodiesterase [Nitrospinota bacterium]